jgi:hypothetical protein
LVECMRDWEVAQRFDIAKRYSLKRDRSAWG